ncbi:glutathione S-transferase theta-3-like [Vespula squamosa]|uniref:Glutathione S-transferase theta-3-like n=1 Tax=Vespula squamosa TaxID=30214 RepID=A0ABD2C4Y8_VESSQ
MERYLKKFMFQLADEFAIKNSVENVKPGMELQKHIFFIILIVVIDIIPSVKKPIILIGFDRSSFVLSDNNSSVNPFKKILVIECNDFKLIERYIIYIDEYILYNIEIVRYLYKEYKIPQH